MNRVDDRNSMRVSSASTACRARLAFESTAAGDEADLWGLLTEQPCLRTLEQAEVRMRLAVQRTTGKLAAKVKHSTWNSSRFRSSRARWIHHRASGFFWPLRAAAAAAAQESLLFTALSIRLSPQCPSIRSRFRNIALLSGTKRTRTGSQTRCYMYLLAFFVRVVAAVEVFQIDRWI